MDQPGTSRDSMQLDDSIIVEECVRYIICRQGSKLPINKKDIFDHLKKYYTICKNKPKLQQKIISDATDVLIMIYGFQLVELDEKKNHYIVLRSEQSDDHGNISTYINENNRKILIAALTHIFMNGHPVKEAKLWDFLIRAECMSVDIDSDKIKKMFKKDFTKQLYLKYSENDETFEWGERAHRELPKEFILQKMSEACNKPLNYWVIQQRMIDEEANKYRMNL